MADKIVESGFPVDGGAGEKLAHPSDQARKTELITTLKTQALSNGRTAASGFIFCASIQARQE